MKAAARGREGAGSGSPVPARCWGSQDPLQVTHGKGWHEEAVQHLLQYPFLCKINAKVVSLPQAALP